MKVQINQELKISSHIPSSKSVLLKEGDIYSALVKERLPQNEAILQIRGQDIKVKFEGEPPKQNQVTVEVTGNKQAIPQVKAINLTAQKATNQSNGNGIASQLNGGAPVSNGTQSAVDLLLSKGIPLNKDTFQQIQSFMDNKSGTIDQKLETISALIKKGLEPTTTHLKAVHQALHDKSFAGSIEQVLKEINPEFRFKSQGKTENFTKSVGNANLHNQSQLKPAVQLVTESINLLERTIVDPKKLSILQQVKSDISISGGNVTVAVQNVRQSFVNEIKKMPEVATKLAEAIKLDSMANTSNQNQSGKLDQIQQMPNQVKGQEATTQKQLTQNAIQRTMEVINQLEKTVVEPKILQQIKSEIAVKGVPATVQNLRESFSNEIKKMPEVATKLTEAIKLDSMAKGSIPNQSVNQLQSTSNQTQETTPTSQKQLAQNAIQRVKEAIYQLEKTVVEPKKLEVLHQIKSEITIMGVPTTVQNVRQSFSNEIKQMPEVASRLSDSIKLDNMAKAVTLELNQNSSRKIEQFQQQKNDPPQTIEQNIKLLKDKLTESSSSQNRSVQTVINQVEEMNHTAHKLTNNVLQSLEREIGSPINLQHLKNVQEGLQQGKSIEQSAEKLLKTVFIENKLHSLQLDNARRLEMTGVALLKNEISKLDQLIVKGKENISTKTNTLIKQSIEQAISVLQKEPKMNDVFEKVSSLLDKDGILELKQKEALSSSINKAEDLARSGKELGARQELAETLTKIKSEIPLIQNQTSSISLQSEPTEAYKMQEELINSLPIQSKDFIVETVSKKISQVAIDFKNFKNDLSKSLHTVEQLVQQFKSQSTVTAKPMLETIIKKLDQAILRSDFMLYADMKTEKKLLTASTQLANAKNLLSKGDYSGANKIVSDIRKMLDKMIFKPSDVRVQHFVSQELGKLENLPFPKQVTQNFEQSMSSLNQEPTARNSYEYLRNLGLTHESDHANALVAKDRNQELSPSIKNLLLKMTQNDGELQQSQKADQALNNITGQQLLSKNDSSGLQNLMFTLPLLLQDKLENVKVFVNSKNTNDKIDWENCSLFFLFETRKLGEVGIALTSTDRSLSVKIKNDQVGFKEKMEPLAELAKDRLSEIGYKIGSFKFEPLHKIESKETTVSAVQQKDIPRMTEKGYDFTI